MTVGEEIIEWHFDYFVERNCGFDKMTGLAGKREIEFIFFRFIK